MAQKVDVLIINPCALNQIYQELSNELAAIETPIWAGLIANHLRVKNHSIALLDCEGENLTVAAASKRVADYDPKLTVIVVYGQTPSASTQNMYGASILCTALKEAYPERKILFVGGHISALPRQTMQEEKADFVCQGEGPHTITSLLASNMDDLSQIKKIPGLWYRDEDGKISFTQSEPVIPQKALPTELPGIAWDLLPMQGYRAHNWHCYDKLETRSSYASIYTSLGCPFRCAFCCIHAPFGKSSFRYWDPQFMIQQFDTLAEKYNVRNIKIADEMFVLNERHFLELCRLLKEHGHGFNIWAYARVDTIKPHYLKALKDAGVNWLALGIESGSKFVRDGVAKGRFGQKDIVSIVKQIKEAGIYVIGNYIFGLPDDDFDTMQETLDLAVEINCEMANLYSAMAYPGSRLYSMAVESGWRLPNSWLGYSQHAFECLPLPTKKLRAEEVLAFRDRAWDVYFNSPRYLEMIRNTFGETTHQHVLEMNSYELKRKYRGRLPDHVLNRPNLQVHRPTLLGRGKAELSGRAASGTSPEVGRESAMTQ